MEGSFAFRGDGAALEWTSAGRDLSLPGSRCWRLCGESITSRGLWLLSVACSLPVLNDSCLIACSSHRATEIIVCMHPCLSEQARVAVLCGASGSPGEYSWNLILTAECNRLATFFVCKMKKKKRCVFLREGLHRFSFACQLSAEQGTHPIGKLFVLSQSSPSPAEISGQIPKPTSSVCFVQFAFYLATNT